MQLASEWGLDNVRFLPYQPKERLGASLTAANLHLITLKRGLAGCIVPSKLYGILAAGVPYVAAVEADSEVGAITRAGDCGFLIEPDSDRQLVEIIRAWRSRRGELRAVGLRGRRLAESWFDRSLCVGRFARVLEEVAAGAPSPYPCPVNR
jgi:glycosyltransferase involved in cell wall biosynthesis